MANRRHRNDTATFEELDYVEQTKSISAQMLNLKAAIKANIRRAHTEKRKSPLEKRIKNLEDLVEKLKAMRE